MELWIRSQDKEYLEKVDKIELFDGLNNDWTLQSVYRVLGRYKTKERALEILDEIQNELEKRHLGYPNYTGIYEMPKE